MGVWVRLPSEVLKNIMKQKRFKTETTIERLRKEGKITTIPPEQLEESNKRINEVMKKVRRDFIKKSKMSEIKASQIILNS